MKNIFKALFALPFLFAISCDDVEPIMYNPNEGQTYLSFSSAFYTLPVVINDEGSVNVILNSSTVSSVDRVYNIEIVAEETNANPLTYTLPATVTIPAGSFQGILTIQGEDNGLVDATPDQLVIKISNITGEAIENNLVTVNIVEVCPLGDDFVGTYAITQLTAGLPVNGVQPMLGSGTLVNIQATSEYERAFTATPYPGISGAFPPVTVRFSLSCGQTVLSAAVDTGNGCSENNNIQWNVGNSQSTYINTNDNVFQLTVTEEATSSCVGPRQTILRFTKQ